MQSAGLAAVHSPQIRAHSSESATSTLRVEQSAGTGALHVSVQWSALLDPLDPPLTETPPLPPAGAESLVSPLQPATTITAAFNPNRDCGVCMAGVMRCRHQDRRRAVPIRRRNRRRRGAPGARCRGRRGQRGGRCDLHWHAELLCCPLIRVDKFRHGDTATRRHGDNMLPGAPIAPAVFRVRASPPSCSRAAPERDRGEFDAVGSARFASLPGFSPRHSGLARLRPIFLHQMRLKYSETRGRKFSPSSRAAHRDTLQFVKPGHRNAAKPSWWNSSPDGT